MSSVFWEIATYDELVERQKSIKEFPEIAKYEIENYVAVIKHIKDWVDDLSAINEIAKRLCIPEDAALSYYLWYATPVLQQAIFFYSKSGYFSASISYRRNEGYLPVCAVVTGYATKKGAVVRLPEIFSGRQTEVYKEKIQRALLEMRILDYTAEQLLSNGVTVF
jgi:hypothetical protein